jgi:hypothetical protein
MCWVGGWLWVLVGHMSNACMSEYDDDNGIWGLESGVRIEVCFA